LFPFTGLCYEKWSRFTISQNARQLKRDILIGIDMGKIAVYPGSFDPVTNGHCDVVRRGLRLFDKVIVAIARNGTKAPLFTIEERLEMLRETFKEMSGVQVDSFDGLLVDYAADRQADAILRGLRAVSDFEYEFQMALMNRKLNRKIQTVFLMTGLRWIFISSSIIKEAARFGGDTRGMVPDTVCVKLKEKFGTSQP
jgi:pantetheine-phosphate adenylyltransferase